MMKIKKPTKKRVLRELEKRAPKLVETGRKMLVLQGTKTSEVVNSVLSVIYHLKRDSAVRYTRRNDNIRPFEGGGGTSLEFFSIKTDCSIFLLTVSPTDKTFSVAIIFGRNARQNLALTQRSSRPIWLLGECMITTSKPFVVFSGEGFEISEELKNLKEVLLDLLRRENVENRNLSGIYRAYVCIALSPDRVFLTHCALRLKKSGTIVPRMELVEVGPSVDLVVCRHRLPNDSLRKEAMKTSLEKPRKKEINVSQDAVRRKIGKIYVPDQKLPSRANGVKRERREAKMQREQDGPSSKRQKEDSD